MPPRTPDLFADPPWSAAAYVAAITGNAGIHSEQELRDHAGEMIESLVQEYSKEIIRRLREELTGLLDELDRDTSSQSAVDMPPPSADDPGEPT